MLAAAGMTARSQLRAVEAELTEQRVAASEAAARLDGAAVSGVPSWSSARRRSKQKAQRCANAWRRCAASRGRSTPPGASSSVTRRKRRMRARRPGQRSRRWARRGRRSSVELEDAKDAVVGGGGRRGSAAEPGRSAAAAPHRDRGPTPTARRRAASARSAARTRTPRHARPCAHVSRAWRSSARRLEAARAAAASSAHASAEEAARQTVACDGCARPSYAAAIARWNRSASSRPATRAAPAAWRTCASAIRTARALGRHPAGTGASRAGGRRGARSPALVTSSCRIPRRAVDAIRWLRSQAAGSATVIPDDPERRATVIVPAGRRLVDQIEVDPSHWALAEAVLGQRAPGRRSRGCAARLA